MVADRLVTLSLALPHRGGGKEAGGRQASAVDSRYAKHV